MPRFDPALKSQFLKYANYEVLKSYEELEAQRNSGDEQKPTRADIDLPQLLYWMENAKLLNRRFNMQDLSLLFMKYNKLRLSFVEFRDVLLKLCHTKAIDLGKLQAKMLEAHEPEYYEFFAARERLYGKKL